MDELAGTRQPSKNKSKATLAYKYVVPERIDMVEKGLIRFTQASALNDPFETNPCFSQFRKSVEEDSHETLDRNKYRFAPKDIAAGRLKIPEMVREKVTELQRQLCDEYPMLSLTTKRNNLLMWSHYASAHRGFVIGFDADNPFFNKKEMPRTITPLWKVNYSDKRPLVPVFDECDKDLTEMLFLTKSDHWAYEEELRMFARPEVADNVIKVKDDFDIYLFKFPPECVREIIFGCLMEQSQKERISELVKEHYANAELFQADLNETDFDLDVVSCAK
jgi:hypothetical protein